MNYFVLGANKIASAQLFIAPNKMVDVNELCAFAGLLHEQHKVRVLLVDNVCLDGLAASEESNLSVRLKETALKNKQLIIMVSYGLESKIQNATGLELINILGPGANILDAFLLLDAQEGETYRLRLAAHYNKGADFSYLCLDDKTQTFC